MLHPSFTPTSPYRHIHTNLHAAAVAKCEHGPTHDRQECIGVIRGRLQNLPGDKACGRSAGV